MLPAAGATLPDGTVGTAYAQNFFLSGGVAPLPGRWPPGSCRAGFAWCPPLLLPTPTTSWPASRPPCGWPATTCAWNGFPPGVYVIEQGEPADALYLILNGTADALLEQPGGQMTQLRRM